MNYRSNKYHNKKVVYEGKTFDSKKELNRWLELKLLERAGKIQYLMRQTKFVLIPAQYEPDSTDEHGKTKKGKLLEREVSYISDFDYYQGGKLVVEDTKGYKTPEYIIKRKLMLYKYGIKVKEV